MKKQAMLDILNQVVNDARTSIPTEVNPEVLQQPKLDKVLKEDDLALAHDDRQRMAERKAKMSAMNKTIQEAAHPERKPTPEREPIPKQEPTAEQEPMPEQPPAAQKKQKRELKKNSFDGSIDVADLTLDLAKLPQLVEELKSAMTAIDIPYSIDVKLSYLSKRLRHEHNLSRQGGISNKTLACLILDNALRNISYGEN